MLNEEEWKRILSEEEAENDKNWVNDLMKGEFLKSFNMID
jgi:hypothetical protein